jgi:AAA domain
LSFEPFGSIIEIKRKKEALDTLAKGKTKNPYLGQFLFDASKAREPQELIEIDSLDLLFKNINSSQKLAVETVLCAPDLALIQGPPGTGKTTVIAEICYQVAKNDGRILIASQSNLAVDNALSRLKHNPIIRAVRRGNKNRVDVEGEPFLEDKVVNTWLNHTAIDCQQRLEEKGEAVATISRLLESSAKFDTYLSIEEEFESNQKQSQQQRDELTSQINTQQSNIESSLYSLQDLFSPNKLEYAEVRLEYDLIRTIIDKCLVEIDCWSSTADRQVNRVLEGCLQNSQYCRAELIELPAFLQILVIKNKNLPWEKPLQNCLNKFNQLVKRYQQRDRIYEIASELDMKIRDLKFLSIEAIDEELIFQINDRLGINQSDSITAIKTLQQETQKSISILSRPLTIWIIPIEWVQDFGYKLKLWQEPSQRLTAKATLESIRRNAPKIVQSLEPANIDTEIEFISRDCVQNIIVSTKDWLNQIRTTVRSLQDNQVQLSKINLQLSKQSADREDNRIWWTEYWQSIPTRFKPEISCLNLFDLDFLKQFQSKFTDWKYELQDVRIYLDRHENIISDWITQITDASEQNRHELRKIYLDNANVVGITCSLSAKKDSSIDFQEFDVVIIDEVSRCTPPELLIPALKAKKLVLVGDHRQLPPMMEDSTIAEIAEELGSTKEELNYLKESLFKSLFESAPDSIKTMLSIQYRMHPDIMMAINQFYEDRLECGLENPDLDRVHHLDNSFIQDNCHIAWIKTPKSSEFREQRVGTSFTNPKEVEAIEHLCQQFEQTWVRQVEQGQSQKEVGIITFYGSQLRLIKREINPDRFPSLNIRINTVDKFQGMEKQIIIVSMVRNNDRGDIGFAKSPERVNVAFSRAQELLVIVGCHSLFTQSPIYSNVSDVVRLNGDLIDVSALI